MGHIMQIELTTQLYSLYTRFLTITAHSKARRPSNNQRNIDVFVVSNLLLIYVNDYYIDVYSILQVFHVCRLVLNIVNKLLINCDITDLRRVNVILIAFFFLRFPIFLIFISRYKTKIIFQYISIIRRMKNPFRKRTSSCRVQILAEPISFNFFSSNES